MDAAREKAQAILALNSDDKQAQELSVNPTKGTINGHDWVDLGLPSGLKWATCNVGASSPESYGSYYAWGETRPKSEYTWENYKFRVSGGSSENVTFSKYNTEIARGTVDNKTRLDPGDDAARANWGGSWRLPTDAELTELRTQCSWTWTTQGGKNGYKVTSKMNGNSIFLPAAGYRVGSSLYFDSSYGSFWSSALITDYPYYAWRMSFFSGERSMSSFGRSGGFSVRPVTE